MAKLDFDTPLSGPPGEALDTQLAALGYTPTAPGTWSRGSTLGNIFGLTTRSWPAEVRLRDGRLTLSVRAGGQILTRSESTAWDDEWALIRAAVHAAPSTVAADIVRHRYDLTLAENTFSFFAPLPLSVVASVWIALSVHPLAGLGIGLMLFGLQAALIVVWLVFRR